MFFQVHKWDNLQFPSRCALVFHHASASNPGIFEPDTAVVKSFLYSIYTEVFAALCV
ncbi:hypothetical protein COCSUDRAFT_33029 [Coccomyxa subellipsoidea C-169]|uniref:Uncharacterized protein n=1 Tax=Coccomyxa subellipsoidea (strain C-169) TaxID=574566 RepID=I0Z0Y9_COCSC|nr:hypothetical protein COCSUDRAFT_33029 [Coccomyxa subellipsoidea C-169]EIE24308.1 hypothetical protein COCSUDRAFT_33029 [Coccomyxa subellipsoidea C-169]|eukprot:XP_005648852.1 hypothetical protein COCSUDRAFT_33029 [Coccomyxa subellipsoidea C-169]